MSLISLFSSFLFRKRNIVIILVIFALLSGVILFFYVNSLRSQLQSAILEKNIALKSLEESNKTIDFLRENIVRQQTLLNESRQNIRRIENQRAILEKDLRNLNLHKNAVSNPTETNRLIQQKLDNIFDRLENMSKWW